MSDELRPAHKFAWGLLVLAVAGLIGYAFWKKSQPSQGLDLSYKAPVIDLGRAQAGYKPEDLAVIGHVTGFSLTDQDGKKVEAKDLLGEVWVADFIFTHCAGTCPLITRQMALLDKELADLPGVKLISISMDPERDTPEVLAKYAKEQEAVSPRWKFLTGDKQQIYKLTMEQFLQAIDDRRGATDEPILHSTRLVLVDARGDIRGAFDSIGPDGPKPSAIKLLASCVRKLRTLPPVQPAQKKDESK